METLYGENIKQWDMVEMHIQIYFTYLKLIKILFMFLKLLPQIETYRTIYFLEHRQIAHRLSPGIRHK